MKIMKITKNLFNFTDKLKHSLAIALSPLSPPAQQDNDDENENENCAFLFR